MTADAATSAGTPGPDPANAQWDRSFFGHPRGLSTLFFTEMWERFSYYGMRALLILFMVAPAAKGGLGFPVAKAGAIYGLYTSLVYLAGVPGGWIADRITGQRRAVLYGGIVIAAGHFSMAVPGLRTFYFGLFLIVLGTGLLKPNMSTMVGGLYGENDARRDAGFSIFYMGINLGGLIAPLVCGYLGENINWHYGFGAAGIGMTLGLIQYVLGGKYLGRSGLLVSGTPKDVRLLSQVVGGFAALGAVVLVAKVPVSAQGLSDAFGVILAAIAVAIFTWLLTAKGFTPAEHRRFLAILILFIASCMFWSAFEQAGSTLNLFAERNTNLHAWDAPLWGLFRASYFQSVQPIFIITLAPVFAWIWMALKNHEPTSTAKFSLGLILVGLGFAILVPVASSTNVSPWWLTLTYLLHTMGELCLSPVGLSATTKLAPARLGGLMMGLFFMSISVGDYMGGRMASLYESFPLPQLFGIVAGFCLVFGILMVLMIRPMKGLMGGVN